MNKLCVEIPDGKKAEWVNGVLTLVDDKKDITERIKTFEDAMNELGEENPLVLQYQYIIDNNVEWYGIEENDLISYIKLRIICTALNEGWKPKFTEGECRYYPYFRLYKKDEYDRLSEDEKSSVWLWGGGSSYGSNCGLSYANSNNSWSYAISARLAFKTEELSIYAGKQFVEIYADLIK